MNDPFEPIALGMVKLFLEDVAANNTNYEKRELLLFAALYFAKLGGLRCGIAIDEKEPDWPLVYIELPTGQVSWHMPKHSEPWDGHTTDEKYARIHAWEPPL